MSSDRTMSVSYLPGSEEHEEGAWPSPPDPGDLSKRVARRRAELRLSRAQVAARAGMSLRYLEYLERYPARPGGAALRRLAAALRTTPAALLGAGTQVPPGHGRRAGPPLITRLTPAECHRLIAAGGIGRIAFGTWSGPVVLPVNFAVVAGTIVIRTGEGTIIEGHAGDQVAFEVDHLDEALDQGWSVLARGPAHRVAHPAELRHLERETAIRPWAGGDRDVYVRIIPDKITGRRIECLPAPADQRGQIGQPTGVTPLVVVPAEHLDQPPGRLGQRRVEHARRGVADDIAGDNGIGAVPQDARQRPGRRRGERLVHRLGGDVLAEHDREIGERPILDRDADGDPVQLPGQGGDDLAGGAGRAGGGRHDC
jgi:nitroimidazol reductase NimA-like FMN-containing flavoprotein (pyridoxamine 5'-phosphate oxidase superfamily)